MTPRHVAALKILDHWSVRGMVVVKTVEILAVFVCVLYAADRAPPYKLLSVEPASVVAGQQARIVSHVWRDLSRDCSSSFTRFLVDATGAVKTLDSATATDALIDAEEKAHPGVGIALVDIPSTTVPGAAFVRTVLHYRCNFMHTFKPIEVTIERPLLVLPHQ